MKSFLSVIGSMSEWSGKIFSFSVLAAALVVTYEVVMRYAFNAPTVWGLDMTIFLCGATYVMAGPYAHYHNAHVKIEALYGRWTPRVRAIIDLLVTAPLFFGFCGVLVWVGTEWTWEAVVKGTAYYTEWHVPIWPMRLLIPLAAFLLLLQGLAKFIGDLATIKGKGAV